MDHRDKPAATSCQVAQTVYTENTSRSLFSALQKYLNDCAIWN